MDVRPLDGIDEAREEWAALALAASNPFLTPEWAETWLSLGGERCDARLFAALRDDGSIAAIVPLVLARGRYVRKARLLGFGPATEPGPVAAPADAELAYEALRAALDAT